MIMSKMTTPKKAVNLSRNSSASAASSTSSTSSKYFFSSSKKGLSLHCPKCALKLMSVEMVQIHMANCTGKGKPSEKGRQSDENGKNDCKIGNDLPCEFCDDNRKFTPHGLILHKSRIHGVKPTATAPVKEKEKDNSQETSFKCSKCPYKSPYKNNIKLHEEIHEGDILFHCKFCRAPFRSELGRKNCEKNHQGKAAKTVVKTEPRIQVARRTPKPTEKIIAKSKSAIPIVGRSSNGSQSSNNASTPISRNSAVGTKRTRQQMKNRPQDETEEDDEVEVCEPVKKSAGRPRELVRRDASVEVVQPGASSISSYANMVVNACAQSNLVTFHDVNTLRGTIGKITFQFQCNRCRGELGVARCYRGRAYCVNCCGHPDCD